MSRSGFVLALVLFFGSLVPARAALDPEVKTPYSLRIVLRFAEHPHFTEHFRRELKRELLGQLQAALGNLGAIELIDLAATKKDDWPPLWKQAEEKGLESLDDCNEIGGGKTHFLHIDFADGRYDLQARQHDGTAGFVTPLVRMGSTNDRGYVARLAGLTIGQDFGAIATLDPAGAGERVFIKAKAFELGSIDKWVKKGEVFAVVAIRAERRRLPAAPHGKGVSKSITVQTGTRVDGVLLHVIGEPQADGRIPCRIYHRYEEPLPRGGLGFRCVKLGTTKAPLQLQLFDAGGLLQKGGALQVFARAADFPEGDREGEQAVNRDGVFVSKETFANVAFVRVMLGNRRIARIPIELLDDRVEKRKIRLDPAAELRDRLDAERRALSTRLTDGRLIQVRCFQEITALELAGKKTDAHQRGQDVLRLLDASAAELRDEIDKLRARAAKELPKADGYGRDCEQQLQLLRSKQDELRQHLDALQVAIAEDNDPKVQEKKKKIQDLIRTAELLISQAEYDRALVKYEEALAEVKDEPAAKQRLDVPYQSLKKAWALKPGDAAHAEARRFIIEQWPKLAALADVRDQLASARRAFEKCKAAGDRLAVNKMQIAAVEVAAKFGDELKKFADMAVEEEEKKALENYVKVNEDLQKLLKDVQDYLQADAKK